MSSGHSHSHAPDRSTSKRSLRIAMALTASFMAAEVMPSERYEGTDYRFCSDSCRDTFREDPAAALAAARRS